ncbi:MAG: cation:proton antiporter [Dehalococcoidales bacterium]|nr:cation:proton antiporter [Dehalococcoidales bacterium]
MNLLLILGIILVVGFLGGKLTEKIKFPRISGYILIGVLLSPSVFSIVAEDTLESLNILTSISLGIIAFLIGGSLHLKSIKQLGKSIAWITPFESLGAFIFVSVFLVILTPFLLNIPGATFKEVYLPLSITIGAIACATAPAATVAVIREYRAKGPLTTTLLAVVGLDDAIAVITFALACGLCQPLIGAGTMSLGQMIGLPLLHIVEALAIGAVSGVVLVGLCKKISSQNLVLVVVFGMLLLNGGLAELLGVSAILISMVTGFIATNAMKESQVFSSIENIEETIFVMFFVLAGMHFNLEALKIAGILAGLIVVSRYLGKYLGARTGAFVSHASDSVQKYLGLGLLPQAGVALGLSLVAKEAFPAFGDIIVNGVLASVIINELITPIFTRLAIIKSGEANLPVNTIPELVPVKAETPPKL